MKKLISIIICAIVTAMIAVAFAKSTEKSVSFIHKNTNALMKSSGPIGLCGKTEDKDCVIACKNCLSLLYAPNERGPVTKIQGRCPNCNHELSLN